MFQKMCDNTDALERGNKYTGTDFWLSFLERAAELLYLVLVFYRLGELVGGPIAARLPGTPAAILTAIVLISGFFLARGLVSMARSALDSAFRLDPRPFWKRLRDKLAFFLLALPYLTLGTALAFLSLGSVGSLPWALVFLAVVWAGLLYLNAL